jgi:hypothetical protein
MTAPGTRRPQDPDVRIAGESMETCRRRPQTSVLAVPSGPLRPGSMRLRVWLRVVTTLRPRVRATADPRETGVPGPAPLLCAGPGTDGPDPRPRLMTAAACAGRSPGLRRPARGAGRALGRRALRWAAFPGPIARSCADPDRAGPDGSGSGPRRFPWPGPLGQQVSTAQGWASMALPGSAREVRGDDRVELDPQQPGIAANQLDPCPHDGDRCGSGGGCGVLEARVVGHAHCRLPGEVGQVSVGQASICLGLLSGSVLAMAILRGLAFSAIGIRNVNTPAS